MAKQKVTKELKDIINSAGWEEIAKLLKTLRESMAVKILTQIWSDEKQYSETDFWKRQLQVCNALLKLPSKTIEVDEEVDIEAMVEEETTSIEVGDVNDLFKSQDS